MKKSKTTSLLMVSSALVLASCSASDSYHARPLHSGFSEEIVVAHQSNADLYKKGSAYLASSDYGFAINSFRQDIKMNGPNVPSLNGLGIAYDALGRFDLSQTYYEQALELEPATAITYSNLAYSQYKQGEYDNAIQLAEAAKDLLDEQKNNEISMAISMVADRNKEKAQELEKIDYALSNSYEVADNSGYIIEKTREKNWEMVKPKDKAGVRVSYKYKSDIPIGKILNNKSTAKEVIKVRRRRTELSKANISKDTRDIEPLMITELEEQETSPIPLKKPKYLVSTLVPLPSVKPENNNVDEAFAMVNVPIPKNKPILVNGNKTLSVSVPLPSVKPENNHVDDYFTMVNVPVPKNKPILREENKMQSVPAHEKHEIGQAVLAISKEEDKNKKEKIIEVKWKDRPIYRILNGNGRQKMARRLTSFVAEKGLVVTDVADARHFNYKTSYIEYAPNYISQAKALASILPIKVELKESKDLKFGVVLTAGKDMLNLDDSIETKNINSDSIDI